MKTWNKFQREYLESYTKVEIVAVWG